MALLKRKRTTQTATKAAPAKKAESKNKTYQVTLPADFAAPRRVRSGIEVLAGSEGYVGPLTAEQLKAIKADELMTVKEA